MSTYDRPVGTGTGGLYAANDRFTLADANQMKVCIDKTSLGCFVRGHRLGGTDMVGIDVNADGDVDLYEWDPYPIDNTSGHFSSFSDANGASLIFRVRFRIRVSDAAISATPKIRYGTTTGGATTVATLSGAAACSAVDADYSGTNQQQTVSVTLPSGVNFFKAQLTIASTGGNPYTVWGKALLDFYIQNTI